MSQNRRKLNEKPAASTFGQGIIGKTFTIINTNDLKPGDWVIKLHVMNVGYEVPLKVKKIERITKEFYDVEFEGQNHKKLPRFASTYLFGRLVPK